MFRRKESEEVRLLKLEVSQREALIEKLQANYLRIDQEKTELEKALEEARKIINEYVVLGEATPSDCKRGEWCRGCEFSKPVTHSAGIFGGIQHTYFCGKAESCKNFVQKEF